MARSGAPWRAPVCAHGGRASDVIYKYVPNAEPLPGPEDRLDSWKEIAAYLKRGVRTVQRWERLNGLPVHRLELDRQGAVYAYKPELDAWWESRRQSAAAPSPPVRRIPWRLALPAGLAVLACAVGALVWWKWTGANPDAPPVFSPIPLTSDLGQESAPTFSPDGRQVAYCWDGPDQDNYDIYVKMIGAESALRLTTGPDAEMGPAWSPDGSQIAFFRSVGQGKAQIVVVPPLGGPQRVIAEIPRGPVRMSWSPDGRWIACAEATGRAAALIAIDTRSGGKRRLTQPRQDFYDLQPAVAPDGSSLVFVRRTGSVPVLYRLALTPGFEPGGEPERLGASGGSLALPAFTASGRAVVYSGGIGDDAASLWVLPLTPGASPRLLLHSAGVCTFPAVSRRGGRLAYSVGNISRSDTWRLDLTDDLRAAGKPVRLISSTHTDYHARYSPDGSRIVFHSTRSGSSEIWTCDASGANAVRLTSFGVAITGSPRWSPDGRSIAFDSDRDGHFEVYRVPSSGGDPQQLTRGASVNAVPSYSRDGRYLYFVSNRSGSYQVWKMSADGSNPRQITRQGGYVAWESPDGRWVYYSERQGMAAIRRVPVSGGAEEQVLDRAPSFGFCVTTRGLFFLRNQREIERLDLETGRITPVFRAENRLRIGLDVSPDLRHLLFSQGEPTTSDLMLVENFGLAGL